jgi:small-conductance mechanosensitive channel
MKPFRSFTTALFCAIAASAFGQQADTTTPVRDSAPVVIANRTIIVLRGPIAGYSARDRVAASTRRIEDALAGETAPEVSTENTEDGTQVLLGGKPAFLVTRIDTDPQVGETTAIVAREAAKRLQKAVFDYRDQHTPRYLATAAGLTVVAMLVLAAILWLLRVADRWIGPRLAAAAAGRAERLHVRGVRFLDPGQARWTVRRLVALPCWLLALFASYSWLTFSLKQFPFTRPWGEQMEGNLFAIVGGMALGIARSIPGLVVAVLIFLLARVITRIAGLFFARVESGRVKFGALDADTVVPTRRIFGAIVWAFAIALAFPYLPGADTEAFKGVSVLVGLMVTIGASSVVGQGASGLILMYTRAFRAGEYVRIGTTEGTVVELGSFATRLRTGLGDEVLLPNAFVLQNPTRNYSRAVSGSGFVIDTGVTIGYSTPWRQVHAMLEEAARRTEGVGGEPAPFVRQTALSDFYVEYRLIAYAQAEQAAHRVDVLSRLHANIQDVFNEHGVQIMSPHYMTDPAEPQVVPKARWHLAPAPAPKAAGDGPDQRA